MLQGSLGDARLDREHRVAGDHITGKAQRGDVEGSLELVVPLLLTDRSEPHRLQECVDLLIDDIGPFGNPGIRLCRGRTCLHKPDLA